MTPFVTWPFQQNLLAILKYWTRKVWSPSSIRTTFYLWNSIYSKLKLPETFLCSSKRYIGRYILHKVKPFLICCQYNLYSHYRRNWRSKAIRPVQSAWRVGWSRSKQFRWMLYMSREKTRCYTTMYAFLLLTVHRAMERGSQNLPCVQRDSSLYWWWLGHFRRPWFSWHSYRNSKESYGSCSISTRLHCGKILPKSPL